MPYIYTPAMAYMLEAHRIQVEMQDQGLDLTDDQAHELAHARLGPAKRWVDHVPELSPEAQAILDRIVAERERARPPIQDQAQAQNQGQAIARRAKPDGAEGIDVPKTEPAAAGVESAHAAVQSNETAGDKRPISDPITRYLADDQDDDHDWRPT